jgi:hypothetical protein
MQTFDICGTWKGYYEFGPGYRKRLIGRKTSFVLNLKGVNDGFSGECIDETDINKSSVKAAIKGFCTKSMISFIKQYPFLLFLNDRGKRVIDENSKHPEIEYTGFYNEETKEFSGTWKMVTRTNIIGFISEAGLKEKYLSGNWKMAKEDVK